MYMYMLVRELLNTWLLIFFCVMENLLGACYLRKITADVSHFN